METQRGIRQKFELIGSDSKVTGEDFLGFISQYRRLAGTLREFARVGPASVKGIGEKGARGRMERRFALEMACD
jgi:hypothetical protein